MLYCYFFLHAKREMRRVHVERDDSQRVEPALEDRGEDDVEEHRKLKFWASRESGQRLSDCTIDAEKAQH